MNMPTSYRSENDLPPGKRYWRGLEELAESPAFQEWAQREFPEQAAEWTDPLTRRQFLMLMGASLALAGVSGCSVQPAPAKRILPYVRQPDGLVPGRALYYATAMTLGGYATGLLVESHEGRPTKVEGNPQHPASLGATDLFAQASILGLYDPDRSQTVTYRGQPRGYSDFLAECQKTLAKQRSQRGRGVRILTGSTTSPLLADQLLGKRPGSFLHEFPDFRWHQYEPIHRDNSRAGSILAFGEAVNAYYDFTKADVIVSLEADFLGGGPGHLRYARQWAERRRLAVAHAPGSERESMNRLYVVESSPTITGATADNRLAIPSREIESFARGLAGELAALSPRSDREKAAKGLLGKVAAQNPPSTDSLQGRWIRAIAADLRNKQGSSVILAGESQPPFVHALAQACNIALDNVGKTVFYTDPVESHPVNQTSDLRDLVRDMEAGRVEVLFILGSNPVYEAPADLDFSGHLRNVPLRIHLGLYQDETAAECHWHVPEAHYLEGFSDARAFDGTVTLVQPLIEPLYQGVTIHELLSALVDESPFDGRGLLRRYWRQHLPGVSDDKSFEAAWERALRDGLVEGTALKPRDPPALSEKWMQPPVADAPDSDRAASETLEISFRPDPTLYDGRFANNGWLQETPKPITKLTWDNAIFVSPATAQKLSLKQTFGIHGGEHGEARVDEVELEYRGQRIRGPTWILPGQADGSVTVHLGHGRSRAGNVGNRSGFNAYLLRSTEHPWFDSGVQIRLTGERHTLACTQMHHSMEGRDLVKAETLAEFQTRKAEHSNSENSKDPRLIPLTLYPPKESTARNQWGMVIDLAGCIGCSACVVACQAENNIPVVGKTEVTRGREMHWLRIDRYYTGNAEDPNSLETYFQPVPCMHCENAPCELVCPVGATTHSADGLNDMVYNRCVGTRYCSNNCPYKVRRFNFLEYSNYATESLKLGRNPEVTVRTRGVMEKCTYCVQRIRAAQVAAEVEGRPLRDGDVLTACQAVCPASAIHFGDLNDPKSDAAKLRRDPRNYALLEELGTRPRTTYLQSIRNPNPDLT
ncbi:MAG TPA: TAT-variant-translocated molybdopterin oxidoreductase [Gemmataceae bacterium]|nr:TAT-variant-translocated molybdopterin oxidoreductase [Gemmataceae bacterium]